jgi:xanthine dehydrogenase YagR molybdenum-binding subunit
MFAFGAHFVQVQVNSLTGTVRVTKAVTSAGVGKVINEKTARSQSISGVVGGIGYGFNGRIRYGPSVWPLRNP